MRLATFEHGGRVGVGEVRGDQVIPLAGLSEIGAGTPLDRLTSAQRRPEDELNLAEVRLLPVVPHPAKIFCVGLNYADHIEETGRDTPVYPVLFPKYASSLIGPTDEIALPPESAAVDWEGELVVVVGRAGRRIPPQHAMAHVAGYAVANDITMRDYQYKTHQWMQGKAWDRSTPVGPFLVTPDEVQLSGAAIKTRLNGDVVQHSDLGQLIFDVATLVALISEFTGLVPGDLILTGTPGGVGYRRDPQVFLQPGDNVSVEIEGVGRIENYVVAEAGQDR